MTRLSDIVFVFDLDDTLYPEYKYHLSGLSYLLKYVDFLYGSSLSLCLDPSQLFLLEDPIQHICDLLPTAQPSKESLLWAYRLHSPTISLDPSTEALLKHLYAESAGVIILTDGRSISQRQKIHSLSLSHLPAYISEDFNDLKPSIQRFTRIMYDYPASKYIYVGDNPAKDFIAPNQLGWFTVGIIGNHNNVHPQPLQSIPSDNNPSVWIQQLDSLLSLPNTC